MQLRNHMCFSYFDSKFKTTNKGLLKVTKLQYIQNKTLLAIILLIHLRIYKTTRKYFLLINSLVSMY